MKKNSWLRASQDFKRLGGDIWRIPQAANAFISASEQSFFWT
jgi:hypothetical protein